MNHYYCMCRQYQTSSQPKSDTTEKIKTIWG
jgi:hypothetical protein